MHMWKPLKNYGSDTLASSMKSICQVAGCTQAALTAAATATDAPTIAAPSAGFAAAAAS